MIVWWWRALKSFNREERAKVLSFATGTSRVPLNGFVDLQGVQGVQRFSIHRAYGDPDRLPQAHTCESFFYWPVDQFLTNGNRFQPDRLTTIFLLRDAAATIVTSDQRGRRGLWIRMSIYTCFHSQ